MNENHEIKCDWVIILPCLKLSQTTANIFLGKFMFKLLNPKLPVTSNLYKSKRLHNIYLLFIINIISYIYGSNNFSLQLLQRFIRGSYAHIFMYYM